MFLKKTILVQALYYTITGLWPLIDIGSFMQITGPKTDIWLVKMVGLLSTVIGLTLLLHYFNKKKPVPEAGVLGVGGALSFAFIDVYYALTDVISNVYMADAAVQVVFVLMWIMMIAKNSSMK